MSVRELTRRAGCWASLVLKVERGVTTPSAGVVYALANELGVSLDYAQFLTRSTVTSSRTIEWETPAGLQTYPLVVVEVSCDSHAFWTGTRHTLDTAGRVEKFYRRCGGRPW